MALRVHVLQHERHEGLGTIAKWCRIHHCSITTTYMYSSTYTLPPLETFDWLVILGGNMSVQDTERHPWIQAELAFIRSAVSQEKVIIAICLGAQLLATALGASVQTAPHKEIGWFPVWFQPESRSPELFPFLPEQLTVLHWHEETFTLPFGTTRLAASAGCENQGFISSRFLGLQFHLEWDEEIISKVVSDEDMQDAVTNGPYVQSISTILKGKEPFLEACEEVLFSLLDKFNAMTPPPNCLRLSSTHPERFREFQRLFSKYGVNLSPVMVEFEAVKGPVEDCLVFKATQVGEGVIVEDFSLEVEGGDYVDVPYLYQNLIAFTGRRIRWRVLLAIKTQETVRLFEGSVMGKVVSPRGGTEGLEPIFEPEGSRHTLAEKKPDAANAYALAVANFTEGTTTSVKLPIYRWST
eukprot:TRINITY_DN94104_c0_g1_i1.p1 TRINITY_DN94104_c0_g1~~TRINITY_DN94104_c0_g1_i1.p1  ORF type:complete len:423 (-),score=52.31 TRINITY_DN94104_c0_g1_i1:29-1261(-)